MAKQQLVPDSVWDRYKTIINDFVDVDAGRQVIIWRRHITQPTEFAEDTNRNFTDINLEALIGYNYFRSWPLNKGTTSGEIDNQSVVLWVTARLLEELGYLNATGYWSINPSMDRFILNGVNYKASGDTQVAQAKDEAILFMVILKREELND